uniref:CCHC-type domain-containing protein n=1 Tax=Noccaea caerulescens TaxID=107243 RepID=A0A1J3IWF1_NOCCA
MDHAYNKSKQNWRVVSKEVLRLRLNSMSSYCPVRVCKCGKCECDLGTLQEQDREEEKVHYFLCGLDDSYCTVRSTLASRVPIQPLEEVYNAVRQEKDLKNNVSKPDENAEVTAYAVHSKPKMNYTRSEDPEKTMMCKHCNRTGHRSKSCFAIIGYP